jgi:membrane protein
MRPPGAGDQLSTGDAAWRPLELWMDETATGTRGDASLETSEDAGDEAGPDGARAGRHHSHHLHLPHVHVPPTLWGVVSRASTRGQEWADSRDPGSASGVAVDAWRRYRAVDGPLQSALLSLYVLVAVFPALLVMEEYLDAHPAALANRLIHHYDLNDSTAGLLRDVLVQDQAHKLGSALIAVAGALFFGLNFGRVLQLVHARAWRITLPTRESDLVLYAGVLLAIYGLLLVLLVQLAELKESHLAVKVALGVGWTGLLVLFFVWAPWLLTHKQISRRDLLPGALATALGLVVVMAISNVVVEFWVNLYARDYGGFGVVLAIYFWIAFSSAVIVFAAALSPALAQRRSARTRA